jgi:hypothetical protein
MATGYPVEATANNRGATPSNAIRSPLLFAIL